jgi:hypothetical protein
MNNKTQRYLRKDDGQVFPYTAALSQRDDMNECDEDGVILRGTGDHHDDDREPTTCEIELSDAKQELAGVKRELAKTKEKLILAEVKNDDLTAELDARNAAPVGLESNVTSIESANPVDNATVEVPDDEVINGMVRNELELLANSLKIEFRSNIGDDGLKARIKEYIADAGE